MLTYLGLIAERGLKSFWPFFTSVMFFSAFGLLDIPNIFKVDAFGIGLAGVFSLVLLSYGVWKFRLPDREEALLRLDKSMPARPLQGISDLQALGVDDPVSKEMWEHHRINLIDKLKRLNAVAPDLNLSSQDPFGLRYSALFIFIMGLIFGSITNLYKLSSARNVKKELLVNSTQWEGWIMPPDYSALPTLYLNDLVHYSELAVLKGSQVEIHLYGETGNYTLKETLSVRNSQTALEEKPKHIFQVVQEGSIDINGPTSAKFDITLSPDYPPSVSWNGKLETNLNGESTFLFKASDDYGVVSGVLQVDLDLAILDRKYGLAVAPRERNPIFIDLPLPFNGDRLDFVEKVVADFSKSVWVNLPVQITLQAQDAVDQLGKSKTFKTKLPGRKFFDPLAAALIELRRDLLWSDHNGLRVANVLRAISSGNNEIFRKETDYLRLRFIITRLEAALHHGSLEIQRDELAEALWSLAISIEELNGEDALDRMRRAKERLSEALKNGASKEEIAELMRELKRANEDYLRQLSRKTARGFDEDRQSAPERESMMLSQNDIQEMMERIQRLIEEGRVAEAQKALQELQETMENIQAAEGDIGEGSPNDGAIEGLVDTLRGQQRLSDEAFSQLQKQFEREQNGQSDRAEGNGMGLAEREGLAKRQDALREQLEAQRKSLPGFEIGGGANTQKLLSQTEEAMRQAERSLKDGDFSGALDEQSKAMENLRDMVRRLSQSINDNQNNNTKQQSSNRSKNLIDRKDPLGRMSESGSEQFEQESDLVKKSKERRAQDLIDEIRRREGEFERSDYERRYLRKLLDKF